MMLVVALNPALDVTHHVDDVDWTGVNRPTDVHTRPGGKGLNVARILQALGADALLLGLAGGSTGTVLRSALSECGVPAVFTQIAGETRRTFTVVDTGRGETAIFNEPGPAVSAAEYAAFLRTYAEKLPRSSAVVLSGSLPRGLPAGSYADLIVMATQSSVPVLLDTSGEALALGAAAGPAIVKPNVAELEAAVGRGRLGAETRDRPSMTEVAEAAAELRDLGAGAVVVTLGSGGLLALTDDGTWLVAPRPVTGNPTGAGDATAAGLAHGLVLGRPWAERLSHAAALGAAAVAAPVAGQFRSADYAGALAGVRVSDMERS